MIHKRWVELYVGVISSSLLIKYYFLDISSYSALVPVRLRQYFGVFRVGFFFLSLGGWGVGVCYKQKIWCSIWWSSEAGHWGCTSVGIQAPFLVCARVRALAREGGNKEEVSILLQQVKNKFSWSVNILKY